MAERGHVSESRYEGDVPAETLIRIRARIEEFGIAAVTTDTGLAVRFEETEVTLGVGPGHLAARVAAGSEAALYRSRESVIWFLDQVLPGAAEAMRWSGVSGNRPPNFFATTVTGVTRLSPNFLRVEVAAEGAGVLGSGGGLHFSLLLPPPERTPVWPAIDALGRTVWPEGDDALHRAVYTVVDVDPDAGRFTFDVFEHAGGRTTGWAQRVQPGEVVGVMGPGGGDFPAGDVLMMAGDETALPAIRRILAASGPDRRGRVFVETGDAADRLPLAHPPGITVEWLLRGEASLFEALRDAAGAAGDAFVWFAAEQAETRRAREHFRHLGVPRERSYIAAYWVA